MDTKNKTFTELYNEIREIKEKSPLQKLREEIMEKCNVHEITVNRWFAGKFRPSIEHQNIIAEIMSISKDQLFPSDSKKYKKLQKQLKVY